MINEKILTEEDIKEIDTELEDFDTIDPQYEVWLHLAGVEDALLATLDSQEEAIKYVKDIIESARIYELVDEIYEGYVYVTEVAETKEYYETLATVYSQKI